MRRLAVLGLCLCLFPYCALTAFAEDTTTSTAPQNDAVISVSVPSAHTLTVTAPDGVTVTLDGVSGNNFNIDRLSEPTLAVSVPDGQEIVKIVLNGEDITDKLVNGQYKLPPVYENLALEVETKAAAEPTTSTITIGNLYYFYIELENVYECLPGIEPVAVLKNYGETLNRTNMTFTFDKLGHCNVNGCFKNASDGYNSGIIFELQIDMSYIYDILTSLEIFFDELKRIQGHSNFY